MTGPLILRETVPDHRAKPCWSSAEAFVEERQQTSEDNTEETKLARGALKKPRNR